MAIYPSVNCCLKRFFVLCSRCSKQNKLITNYCLLTTCNNFYKRNFITSYKLKESLYAFSTQCEQNFSTDNNPDYTERDDELMLNNGEDSDEEHEQTSDQIKKENICADNNNDNYNNGAINTENNNKPYPHYIKKNKKFKYDSDITILYDDMCNLPEHFFSFPPTEEEIKHINSGGADYNYGNYGYTISFTSNDSKNGSSNKHSKS